MAEFNLKMIKVFFVVVIAMLVLAMTSGMNIIRGKKLVDWKKIKMELAFMRYKKSLAAQDSTVSVLTSTIDKNAGSVPVLLYHGIITGKNWEEDGTNITLDEFKNQIFALKEAGYKTITLADFYEFMKNGQTLPEKSIMITFDDGRKDSYYEGDPVLKAAGYNAVMFLITGRSLGEQSAGDGFYLGKNELRDMIGSQRWEIQSHGDFDHDWKKIDSSDQKGHFISNLLWLDVSARMEKPEEAKERILEDLAASKKKIESELGQKTIAFAYPFNDYGQASINFPASQQFIRENIGKIYPLTFMQINPGDPAGNYPDPEALYIKRIDVNSNVSVSALLNVLRQNEKKTLPYDDSFWDDRGWKSSWGEKKVWGDLTLYETEDRGGGLVSLLGTSEWKDYMIKSRVQIYGGEAVSQIVRYENDDNYAECNFSNNGISILQKIGGIQYSLAEKQGSYGLQISPIADLGAGIIGRELKCYLNGKLELVAQISQDLALGGIGFSTWDDRPENASVSVKKVNVSPL